MECKYIPERYAGKKVGLEGRMGGVLGTAALLVTFPFYSIAKGVAKVTRKDFDEFPMDEYWDTIKLTTYAALTGRFPKVKRRGSE